MQHHKYSLTELRICYLGRGIYALLIQHIKDEKENAKKCGKKESNDEKEEKIVVSADKPEISKKVKVDLGVDTSVLKI